jgi:hypothetical protein
MPLAMVIPFRSVEPFKTLITVMYVCLELHQVARQLPVDIDARAGFA